MAHSPEFDSPSSTVSKRSRDDMTDPSSTSSDHAVSIFFPDNPHNKTVQEASGTHVYDPNGHHPAIIRTRTLDPLSPLVSSWDIVAPRIIKRLIQHQVKWTAVELFQRSQIPSREQYTTVLITVEDSSHSSLRMIAEVSYQLCRPAFVEIIEGNVQFQTDFLQPLGQLKVPYNHIPQMGSSIGVHGKYWSAGTLGGFLELHHPTRGTIACALSCHHVVCPPEKSKPSPSNSDFHPFQMSAKNVLVDSPSSVDHEKSLAIDEVHLNEIQELKAAQLEKIEMLGNQVPEVRKRGLQRCVEKEQAFIKRITTAEDSDRVIGTLLASSGYRVSDGKGCRLDWGLIRLHNDRVGTNETSDGTIVTSQEAGEAGKALLGKQVIKLGRTTGETRGIINPADSYIHFPGTSYEQFSKEMVVVGTDNTFSAEGDSGSFVVLGRTGELVGILWGGLTTREATFVTPMDAITTDIQKLTGFETRLVGES